MLKAKDSHSASPHYAIKDIPSPALSGPRLLAFLKVIENSGLARQSIMKLNNLKALHALTYQEAPCLLPMPTLAMHERETKQQKEQGEREAVPERKNADGIAAYRERYQTGMATPSELMKTVLANIHSSNQGSEALNAVIEVQEKSLMHAAAESTQRYQKGQTLSPLDGVPIAVKSEIHVKGFRAHAGTSFLEMPTEHSEATLVMRLRQAGALIVGLTNMHEIGIGVTGANIHWGTVRNPYDMKRHTGGSSSGSAAAVTAGLVPIAIGTDGGGSIRIPSSLCGIVGLKPSFARVSSYGLFPSCVSLCQAGPMATNALDCAMVYQLMAGADPRDEKTLQQPQPSLRTLERTEDLSDLTAGVYASWFEHADPEVVAICNELLVSLQKKGLKLVDIKVAELEEARIAHFVSIAAEMHSFMKPYLARHRDELSPTTRFALALGAQVSAHDYLQAQRMRQRSMQHLNEIFSQVDFIVSPTCANVAPRIDRNESQRDVLDTQLMSRLMRFAQLFNLAGNPAISFPAGYTTEGLPVGIQFAGRWWAEAELLRVAHAAESMVSRVLPPLHWSPF